jgi:hypothetical protein
MPPTDCIEVVVDFSVSASGKVVPAGAYVEDEWAEFGLTLSATGGFGTLPRVIDTANPGESNDKGDPDLGAPNMYCSPPGPGVGEGGKPGMKGANCSPLGNALIVQEVNDMMDVPDDNVNGGTIVFDFNSKATRVSSIGLLDVDYLTLVTVQYMTESGEVAEPKNIQVPQLGDNSYQLLSIDTDNVVQLVLRMTRSAAVTSLTFCYPKIPRLPL